MYDPFEQFERTRAGLMIPLLLFLAAAVPTVAAMGAMISIRANHEIVGDADVPQPPALGDGASAISDLSKNPQDKTDP